MTPPTAEEADALATAQPMSASVVVRTIADWVPTGAGVAYSSAFRADICEFEPQGLYVARVVHGYTGRGAFDLGEFVLSQPDRVSSAPVVLQYQAHEAVHARQWSVFTIAAGPLAFPVSYLLDEAFFPGAHNHFERNAGLENGQYSPAEHPPPARSVLMLPAGVLLLVAWVAHRPLLRRWRAARHGPDGCALCGRRAPTPETGLQGRVMWSGGASRIVNAVASDQVIRAQ